MEELPCSVYRAGCAPFPFCRKGSFAIWRHRSGIVIDFRTINMESDKDRDRKVKLAQIFSSCFRLRGDLRLPNLGVDVDSVIGCFRQLSTEATNFYPKNASLNIRRPNYKQKRKEPTQYWYLILILLFVWTTVEMLSKFSKSVFAFRAIQRKMCNIRKCKRMNAK